MENINYSNELNNLINEKQTQFRPVSKNTMNKYILDYLYLTKTHQKTGDWIIETPLDKLMKIINNLDVKASGKLSTLIIILLIKKGQTCEDISSLLTLRDSLNKKKLKQTAELLVKKQNELPHYNEVDNYIENLYETNQYTQFLINFLCFEYGLRNRDLNLCIITLENHKKTVEPRNYLIIRKTDCLLLIADYKTSSKYGVKKIVVRSRRVLRCANKIGEGHLLLTRFNTNPTDDNLSYYINLYTTKDGVKLTESDYYKIRVKQLQTEPNSLEKLTQLSKFRGSSMEIMNTHYNLNKSG